MRKLILTIALLVGVLSFAQTTTITQTTVTETVEQIITEDNGPSLSPYLAVGLSIGDTDGGTFETNSYGSVELGVMYKNLAFGAIVGRNNLVGLGNNETLDNYFYEGKIAVSTSLGHVDGYALVGLGSYFEGGGIFTEYGVGISKELGKFGVFIQVASWDNMTYVTPGIYMNL
jgi:hypothetical protein